MHNSVTHRIFRCTVILLGAALLLGAWSPVFGADNRSLADGDRVIFVGDSITGLGRNNGRGFVHLIEEALKESPAAISVKLAPLGGSGQSVASWMSVEEGSRQQESFLDVKGVPVKATLDGGADVLIIMLGTNDVLAPYVSPDEKSLEQWTGGYRRLIAALKERTKPRVIALATTPPITEDPRSPRNLLIGKLNQQIEALAKEVGGVCLQTNASMFDVLQQGRKVNAAFHISNDYVHPNEAGHLGIAMAMLRGLGQPAAADILKARVDALVAAAAANAKPVSTPPAWLVGTGFTQGWNGGTFDAAASRTPVDEAIEKGQDFTAKMEVTKGKTLVWQKYVPSVDFVGGAAAGSVDFTALTVGENFESAYAARWIYSAKDRPAQLQLSTQIFAGDAHLGVWLNGKSVYQDQITSVRDRKAIVGVALRQGWNVLVLKSNHRTWQWQVSADILAQGNDDLSDLRYEAAPQAASAAARVAAPTSAATPFAAPTLRYHLDKPAQVTLVIEDQQGVRVRNLMGAQQRSAGDHLEAWDGLDDAGKPVAAGQYRWRGLMHGPITSHFQGSFNSPGNPPWVTLRQGEWNIRSGTNGGWLSDHAAPLCSFADGDNIFLGAELAEAGHSIIEVDQSGDKRLGLLWLSLGGANALTVDSNVLYAASEKGWMGESLAINRFDLKTRSYVPNPPAVKARRTDGAFVKEKTADFGGIRGIVLTPKEIVLSLSDRNRLAFFDRESAQHLRDVPLPQAGIIIKTPAGAVLGISGKQVMRLDLENGNHQPLITENLEQPSGLAIAPDGSIYVTDIAPDEQCVKVFSAEGKFQTRIGKPGGRREGAFDPQAMSQPTSVSIDGRGQLWVTEHDTLPKRVSVWSRNGALIRDMVGGPAYGGGGALDPRDSKIAYYRGMAFEWEKWPGGYRITDVLFRPSDHADLPLKAKDSLLAQFPIVRDGKTYLLADFDPNIDGSFIGELRDHHLVPRAIMGQLRALAEAWREQYPDFVQRLPKSAGGTFLWVDKNQDGKAEPSEVSIKEDWDAQATWAVRIGSDLTFYAMNKDAIVAIAPRSGSVLDYDLADAKFIPKPPVVKTYGIGAMAADLDGNLIINCGNQLQEGNRSNVLLGVSPQGKVRWTYPNPYPQNGHDSPRPKLGDIQHTLNVEGVARVGDGMDLFQLNGNKGVRYLFTTDGLFVDQIYQDLRLAPPQQALTNAVYDMQMQKVSLVDECFYGWFGRGKDGRFLQIVGKDSSSVMELRGIESIERLAGSSISLSVPATVQSIKTGGQPAAVEVAGSLISDAWMQRAGPRAFPDEDPKARFSLGADDTTFNLRVEVTDDSPFVNTGDDPLTLFKTGDAVDLRLAINPDLPATRSKPVAGDVRVLFAMHKGKPIAVRYRFVVPGTKQPVAFGRYLIDDVQILTGASIEVRREKGTYSLRARIPWTDLGLQKRPSGKLLGDVGVIFSDATGSRNVSRSYYFDQRSQVVSDLPTEAAVVPARWGPFGF